VRLITALQVLQVLSKGGMGGRHAATPHRERSVVLAVAHPLASASSYLSSQSLSPTLAATFMPPRGRPTLVVLSLVASSSVASLSSASSCDARPPPADPLPSRLLPPLGATPASSRRILAPPSSLSSSPRARTTLLTPTLIICRQVMSLLRSTLVSDTCASTDGVGAGCDVTFLYLFNLLCRTKV